MYRKKFWQMCNIVVIIAVALLPLPCATIWQNFWGEGMAEVILDYIFFYSIPVLMIPCTQTAIMMGKPMLIFGLQLTKRGEKGGLKTNDRK